MNKELDHILESLSEEERKSFYENVKKQAQDAVKLSSEQKRIKDEQSKFKATGHWETEDEDNVKISIDIDEENRKLINFSIDDGAIKFSLGKKTFFNFCKLLADVHDALKEYKNRTIPMSDELVDTINSIADTISCNPYLARMKPFRSKIFHIR